MSNFGNDHRRLRPPEWLRGMYTTPAGRSQGAYGYIVGRYIWYELADSAFTSIHTCICSQRTIYTCGMHEHPHEI
jgi:hypothetical protein